MSVYVETVESPARYRVTGSVGAVADPPPPVALVPALLVLVDVVAAESVAPLLPPAPTAAPPVPVAEDAAALEVLLVPPASLSEEPFAVAVASIAPVVNVALEDKAEPLPFVSALLAVTDPLLCRLLVSVAPVAGDPESLGAVPLHAATSPSTTMLTRCWDDTGILLETDILLEERSHRVPPRANTKFFSYAREALAISSPCGNGR